jgi:hypothetical protein
MRRGLHDGGRGIPPSRPGDTAATRPLSGQKHPVTGHGKATTVLAGGRGADPAGKTRRAAGKQAAPAAVATRRPRQGPPRSRQAAASPPPRARPKRSSGRGRLVGVLLGLMALALVIVAIVVLTAPSPTKVVLRNVVYSDVQQTASALKQLIAENTK